MIDLAQAIANNNQGRRRLDVVSGWVVAWDARTVTVTINDADTVTTRLRSYTSPTANDVVLVLRAGGFLYCLGALNAVQVAPPPPPPPPPPPAPAAPAPSKPPAAGTPSTPSKPPTTSTAPPAKPQTYTRTFRPTYTGTYRGGWRGDTSDLYQGDWTGRGRNYGAAYYGTGPGSQSGTAVSGTVRIKRISGGAYGGQRPTLRLLTNRFRPGGSPASQATLTGPSLGIGATATVSIPTAWVQRLINGTAGGIGIGIGSSSPYVGLAGRSSWSAAFELTLKFRR